MLPLALGMSVPASPMPASKPGPSDDGSFATVAETARAAVNADYSVRSPAPPPARCAMR